MNQSTRKASAGVSISVAPNGPLLVKGGVPLRDAQGEGVEAPAVYALCRCGESSRKPFCDGTHNKAEFTGEESADQGPIESRRRVYKGQGITIYDDRSICSHVGICTDDLPDVFRHKESTFVNPEGEEDIQKAIDVIKRCPSGALCCSLDDSEEIVEEECDPDIQIERDGPYDVTGLVELKSSEGVSYETRARYTLCRCGGSKNKPYCDGTHWHIGFRDG